jgi:Rieske 2Fe-2S family protein
MRTLTEAKPSLPSHWYFDPNHYQRELEAIWYRDWICVGRTEVLDRNGDYFVANIGTQSIIVTRSDDELRAFHNTCRHRGSVLCSESSGHFRNGRIICPYHTWTFSLDGNLVATPYRFETDDFDAADYPLYRVHVEDWRGFVFINLAPGQAKPFYDSLSDDVALLDNWPLEDMHSVHEEVFQVACNWKIFWENYSECYHCPRVHPELCKVMPDYAKGAFDAADLPGWTPAYDGDVGNGTVGNGARTWSMDGQIHLPVIEGPTERELEAGIAFAQFPASLYMSGHPDYVRVVRIRPTGPESIELVANWLVPKSHAITDPAQLAPIVDFVKIVLQQDAEVCELNQRGLHSSQHEVGVLTPQEYELWRFHEDVRQKLRVAETKTR